MTDLAARYGKPTRPRRRLFPWVAGLLLALGVAWAAWVALDEEPVSARLYGYDVVDEHTVKVSLDVQRPEAIAVDCEVYAQSADHSVVGEKNARIPAADGQVRADVEIATERRAVTGVLRGCTPVR